MDVVTAILNGTLEGKITLNQGKTSCVQVKKILVWSKMVTTLLEQGFHTVYEDSWIHSKCSRSLYTCIHVDDGLSIIAL